jgi:DNA-binding MarR family transcriptional regulator
MPAAMSRSGAKVERPPMKPMAARGRSPRTAGAVSRPINPYLAYAEFRIAKHRAKPTSQTFRYFRQTVHHSVLWMIVMRGYYVDDLPSLKDCLHEVNISKDTVRKIINDAQANGYLEWRSTPDDRRKKLIAPTRLCIAEFEGLVDAYSRLLQGF